MGPFQVHSSHLAPDDWALSATAALATGDQGSGWPQSCQTGALLLPIVTTKNLWPNANYCTYPSYDKGIKHLWFKVWTRSWHSFIWQVCSSWEMKLCAKVPQLVTDVSNYMLLTPCRHIPDDINDQIRAVPPVRWWFHGLFLKKKTCWKETLYRFLRRGCACTLGRDLPDRPLPSCPFSSWPQQTLYPDRSLTSSWLPQWIKPALRVFFHSYHCVKKKKWPVSYVIAGKVQIRNRKMRWDIRMSWVRCNEVKRRGLF